MSQVLRQLPGASRTRIRIVGVTPQPVDPAGVSDVVSMNVSIEGRYFAIREFLRLLRTQADIRSDDKVQSLPCLCPIHTIQFGGGLPPSPVVA